MIIKVKAMMLTTTIMMSMLSNDYKKSENNANLRNSKCKSNLNKDNDNSVDNSKNIYNNKIFFLILGESKVKNINGFLLQFLIQLTINAF